MPPKNPINGFALFMYEYRGVLRAQGLTIGGGAALSQMCAPLWAALPAGTKKEYDRRAKEMKSQNKAADGDMNRLDNVGNIVGKRKDPAEEERKRRQRDQELVISQWPGKDLTEERFYFINFQDMCELTESDNTVERQWLPREVALVEFSLQQGIIQHWHQFIDPGPIPTGFRYTCIKHSDETHKIPIEDFKLASSDYPSIWQQMKKFLKSGMNREIYPPLYCLAADYCKTKYLMDWMWRNSDKTAALVNPLGRVYSIEDLVVDLLAHSGKPNTESIAKAQIIAKLDSSQWDFIPKTSCEWHEDQETKYCSLATIRRYVYTFSDILCPVYGIQLTEKHVPTYNDMEVAARILPPPESLSTRNQQSSQYRGRSRNRNYAQMRDNASFIKTNTTRQSSGKIRELNSPEMSSEEEEEKDFVKKMPDVPEKLHPLHNPGGSIYGPRSGNAWGQQVVPQGPAFGTPEDWPELGNIKHTMAEDSQSKDIHSQMSSLSLSNPPTLLAGLGRGQLFERETQVPNPPPGFHLQPNPLEEPAPRMGWDVGNQYAGRGITPSVGRGAPFSGLNSIAPGGATTFTSVLHKSPPDLKSNPVPSVGRGLPVGRGMPFNDGRDYGDSPALMTPSVGRGRGTGAPVGRGVPPRSQGVSVPVGRGYPARQGNI